MNRVARLFLPPCRGGETADAADLKSATSWRCVGSSPSLGTKISIRRKSKPTVSINKWRKGPIQAIFAGLIPSNVPQINLIHSIRHDDRARTCRARFRVRNRTYSSGFLGYGYRLRPAHSRSPHDPQSGQNRHDCPMHDAKPEENPNPAIQIAREQGYHRLL